MSDNYFAHQELVKKTKVLVSDVLRNSARMFDRHVGLFYKKRVNDGMIEYTPIQINRAGMADNWGVIICFHYLDNERRHKIPVHFEVETKTGSGTLTDDQINWRDFNINFGVWWFENRDENILMEQIKTKAKTSGLMISEVNFGTRK